jgi:hypothetical protein
MQEILKGATVFWIIVGTPDQFGCEIVGEPIVVEIFPGI